MDEGSPKVASKVSPIWTGVISQSCASVCNGKTPAVLSHIPYRHFGLLETQNGPGSPKNLMSSILCFFSFLHDCTADAGTHGAKMREDQHFENIFAFLRCTLFPR